MEYKRSTERAENGEPYFDGCLTCDFERDCGLCPYWVSGIRQLAELEDKIEQGTLIELPCKVGDTVYYTSPEYYNSLLVEYKVTEISQTREGIRLAVYGSPKEKGLITYLWASFIGKTVFLTREEAEKRLKELQE